MDRSGAVRARIWQSLLLLMVGLNPIIFDLELHLRCKASISAMILWAVKSSKKLNMVDFAGW